ncbi:hypothetical protein LTS18_008470 [Coniosporium uncinatum]|uniref:Uncharacterized protein n=1 Tax=Coniosporium uncinatum TaxID=93489 RepID=A0ACC3DX19_9PEZI|nr:hypothetical protein LTS18_008470 [Coniosporium uncinatum]
MLNEAIAMALRIICRPQELSKLNVRLSLPNSEPSLCSTKLNRPSTRPNKLNRDQIYVLDQVQEQESWPAFNPTEWMPHGDAERIIDFNADTQVPSFMRPDQLFEEILTNEAERRSSWSGDTPNSSVKNLAYKVQDLQAQVWSLKMTLVSRFEVVEKGLAQMHEYVSDLLPWTIHAQEILERLMQKMDGEQVESEAD